MKFSEGDGGLVGGRLCTVEFEVGGGILDFGASPFGAQRVGYISGGRFEGPKLSGVVLPGGGNWSRAGKLASGAGAGTFDARAVWRTNDDALIYVTYTGRSVVSDAARAAFAAADKAGVDADPSLYYIRVAMVFETSAPAYDRLNGILAVGRGTRTSFGVRHEVFEIG